MGADIIQANYEELETIATRFGHWADCNVEMSGRVRQGIEKLRHGDWIGKGSEAFFKEMDGEVLPALNRLTLALQQSEDVVNEIIFILREAEEEAASVFRGGAKGSLGSNDGRVLDARDGGATPNPLDKLNLDTQAKGILGVLEILEKFKKAPNLGLYGDILGIVLDAYSNPDGNWFKSVGSSTIETVLSNIHPAIMLTTAVSDVVQMVGEWGSAASARAAAELGITPGMTADLTATSGRFYQNIERLAVGNIKGPIADAIFDYSVTPYVDSMSDTWKDPSISNFLRLGATVLGPPSTSFLLSSEAQQAVLGDIKNLGGGVGNFVLGTIDFQASRMDMDLSYGAATVANVTDHFPIPDAWKSRIDDGASWFIDRIEKGVIPGVNIPGVPLL